MAKKTNHFRVTDCNDLKPPHGNKKIWRYLGLDKFLDLITTQELHFTQVSQFTDKFEAKVPKQTIEKQRRHLRKSSPTDRDAEEELASKFGEYELLRGLSFVNCWSIDSNESYALWKIYLEGAKSGVAIQTTVGHLKKAISKSNPGPSPEPIFLGEVRYNYYLRPDEVTRRQLICTKMPYYEYEREARLIILDFPPSEGGVGLTTPRRVPVDLEELVQQVYVSPFTGDWFTGVVERAVAKLCPTIRDRVTRSGVQDT